MVKVKRLLLISTMASIVVVIEKILEFIPNVQLTVVLLMAFITVLSLSETIYLCLVYVVIDVFLGGLSIWAIPMIIMWLIFGIIVYLIKNSHTALLIFGVIYPIIYSIALGLPYVLFTSSAAGIIPYFIADIPFTLLFIASNIVTIIWLYPYLAKQIKVIAID